ncbi:MAG: D-alanyl-D-alanine carboxypeptidase [Bacilli bacterium]|nr:D-alanyl-D-alanine carboxypeptidase [Bacilli bacterium]
MKRIKLLLLSLLLAFGFTTVYADEFEITSDYAVLYNLNDPQIIYEKNSEEKTSIASLTKIMTAIVAIEENPDLNESVTIKNKMLEGLTGYSIVGLKSGNVVTVKDLLYGALLPSGADAVNALAFHTSGNVNAFVLLMNNKAKELGLSNTSFQNPIGMDHDDNYSTAKDVAKLLQYALENKTFKEIFTTRNYSIDSLGLNLKSTLYGYANPFGLDISKITGAKSGFTYAAGYCLASTATINNVDYLLVNIGSDTSSKANAVKDSLTIYNYYSSNYSYQTVLEEDVVLKTLPVKWGKVKTYDIVSNEEIQLYLKNGLDKDKIIYEYEGTEEITSDIKKGDKLGVIKVLLEQTKLTEFNVFLESDIEYHQPLLYIGLLCLVSFIFLVLKKSKKKRKKH